MITSQWCYVWIVLSWTDANYPCCRDLVIVLIMNGGSLFGAGVNLRLLLIYHSNFTAWNSRIRVKSSYLLLLLFLVESSLRLVGVGSENILVHWICSSKSHSIVDKHMHISPMKILAFTHFLLNCALFVVIATGSRKELTC